MKRIPIFAAALLLGAREGLGLELLESAAPVLVIGGDGN
jgi:hypothetical protein